MAQQADQTDQIGGAAAGYRPAAAADGEGRRAASAATPPRPRPTQRGRCRPSRRSPSRARRRTPPPRQRRAGQSRGRAGRRARPTADSAVADKLRDIDHRQAVRPHRQPQGRPRGRRSVLQGARLQAALGRRRRRQRARQGGDRLSRAGRHRRPRSDRLSDAGFQIGGHRPTRWPRPSSSSPTAVLTYARHAQIGRIHFSRVGADIQFNLVAPEPAEVLAKLADAERRRRRRSTATIRRRPEFKALKDKLAELRKGALTPKAEEEKKPALVHVAEGKILRPGMKDARVIALRKRLNIAGDKDNPLYDDAVRDAVKTFQTEADLDVDGNLGPNTVRALNGEKQATRSASADPIDTVIVNMERWRWLPRDLGNPHVIVNVPDYTLDALQRRQGLLAHQDRRRQAGQGDADGQRGDEVHHRQSDLERAAVDHRERISAGAAAGPAGARPHRPQADAGRRTAPCISRSRRAPAMRSAASASTSPTSSWSTSTTRRTNICSRAKSAPTATAACACRTRSPTARSCCRWCCPKEHYTEARLREDVRRQRDQHQLPQADLGAPDLPDRLRRSRTASCNCARTSMAATPG